MASASVSLPLPSSSLPAAAATPAAVAAVVTPSDVLLRCLCGGAGCGVAGFVTNPFDVVKIRNQQYGGKDFGGFFRSFRQIYGSEGPVAFLKGAKASVLREATYSSVRMGFYEPIKGQLSNAGLTEGPALKLVSSFLSGAIGAAMFNPIDLVKVRLQSCLASPGAAPPHGGSMLRVAADVYRAGGLPGLWAALLTSAQLGTYDVIKNDVLVKHLKLEPGSPSTHLAASLVASVFTVTASNPPDVVKTRVMNDVAGRGPVAHAWEILRADGPMGFMKGWTASYCRLGPHTMISLMLIEEIRKLVGLSTY